MVRTTLPFIERRRFRRLDANGLVCAVVGSNARQRSLANLSLQDVSDGGLSAVSRVAWPLAGAVIVMLPPGGPNHLPGRTCLGRIVRCRPFSAGFEVAVAFDQPPVVAS